MSDTEYKLTDEQMHAAFSTIAEEAAQVTFEEFMEDEDAEYLRRFGRAIEAATAAKYAERIAELQAKLDAVAVDAQRYRLLRLKVYIDPKELILRTRDVFLTRGATVPEMLDSALDAMRTGEPKV